MTRTDIHKPAAVTFGGDVHVEPPPQKTRKPETQGPPSHIQKMKNETEKTFKTWTEGMVMTQATKRILNKIAQGRPFVTVTGCPGEGKTTAGYLVLKNLHDRGREVFDVKTPDDYFKAREVRQSVIMLNDIFGALTYDSGSMKKWQNVMSDVLALSEHKQEDKENSCGHQHKKIPELTVILISRSSVLKEASEDMGRYKHSVIRKENVVDITEVMKSEASERIKIWKCNAARYNITIDSKLVREVCNLHLSHGFPHCCRLFADMFSKNEELNMKHFFSKPLDFLQQSMESLMKDSLTGPLLREMLKNDGSLDLESIGDFERQYQYSCVAESLKDTYLTLNGRTIEFHHPSVYDSAAFIICQKAPAFVIAHCSLSFLNERVRVRGLTQDNKIRSHLTLLVDSTYDKLLLERFHKEFKNRNIEQVLLHSSFHDESLVFRFMECLFASNGSQTVSEQIKELFDFRDRNSNKSFLFLMTKSGSDKVLRYIHEYVELTEEERSEALFGCCEHSSVSSLEYLLQRYRDIKLEVTNADNQTPLLVSTQKRSQEIIRILLIRNANVNIADNKDRTPLVNVCQHGVDGDGSVVKILLEKGANASVTTQGNDDEAMSLLDLACREGHTNIVKVLLQFDDVVQEAIDLCINQMGITPLDYACESGHVDVVSLLLDRIPDFKTIENTGITPFHMACVKGHVDVVSFLLDRGVNLNLTTNLGDTPLNLACLNGHVDVVSLLLEKGAVLNTPYSGGDSPIDLACLKGHVDVVSLLLDKGVDLNKTNREGDTPLHTACWNGQVDVVSLLLAKGANLNQAARAGVTPLHSACWIGHANVASLLLGKGADFNSADRDGIIPLYRACWNRHVDIAALLLDRGADFNTTDRDGITPLYRACWNGHVDVASLLLDRGADFDKTDRDGITPLQIAKWSGHVDVASLLLNKGAYFNTTDCDGDDPLK